MYDVIIIGAGVIGSAVARETARNDCSILVLEKGNDVSVGTSKANSGIVHAGFDSTPGSNKARFNVLGNNMFDLLSLELDFPFKRNGSMVLCFDGDDADGLKQLLDKGIKNGVGGLKIVSGEEARILEPNISLAVSSALIAPTGGIVSPYEMTIAYAENAAANGAVFEFKQKVAGITKTQNGFEIKTDSGKSFLARAVVNCAGVYADEINNMINPAKYSITARKGDYVLMDKTAGGLCNATLFQLPGKLGKGVLVTKTVHGNILVGPTAMDMPDKDDVATTAEALNTAFTVAQKSVPGLNRRAIITQFSGVRAHCNTDDFVVGESKTEGFFNALGIESPGLTAAPAIGAELARLVSGRLNLKENKKFNPRRKGIPYLAGMSLDEREKLIKSNPDYGKIVCRCEVVTEGEIVEAIRRVPGAKDLDGVKRRTRAGMGRCQAGFCTCRCLEILARELKCDITDITKCGGESRIAFEKD